MAAEITYLPIEASVLNVALALPIQLVRFRVDDTIFVIQTNNVREVDFLEREVAGEECPFRHIPYDDDAFAWVARQQFRYPSDAVFVLIDGQRQQVRWDTLREIDMVRMVGPVWCPVANMTAHRPYGPDGAEIKHGSKHFAPGAKLYYRSGFCGNAAQQVEVVGHHRGSHRYVTMIVSSAWLVNWRVELAYSPHVIRELWPQWSGTASAKVEAQDIVDIMRQRAAGNGSSAGES